jgi:hypothetical protein
MKFTAWKQGGSMRYKTIYDYLKYYEGCDWIQMVMDVYGYDYEESYSIVKNIKSAVTD